MSEGSRSALADPKRILQLLDKYKQRVMELERDKSEPIAIVGMGCRFPGGISAPEELWQLLLQGGDAIAEIPPDRWDVDAYYDPDPEARGKMYTRAGGFLRSIDGFDPQFFGISPREAVSMDPQQRLLLEVTWESLERAGILISGLLARRAGVFIGIGPSDYARDRMGNDDLSRIDTYAGTGNGICFAAGRLSYVLGLQGPSMTVNTACSSSLVAVHLGCQSLRAGECEVALAGGVHLMLSPVGSVFLSQTRALSPDGRCKTFDARADGYGRAEGCGMVVLKRLRDAQRDGDPILAVLRATAVNHDGRSGGLTVPSGPAQEALLKEALLRAGVAPSDIHYVEAHGTGTSLGDPIEVEALGKVFGVGRSEEKPLLVGSVKTNIGHLEEAAGVAGLIKTVLSLQHRLLPAHLHFTQPNPYIAWDELAVRVVKEPLPWPDGGGRRLAGVSSFGLSGTNAHAIVQEAPSFSPRPPAPARSAELFVLSAKSAAALLAQASQLLAHVAAPSALGFGDVAFSLATTRSPMEHRLAVAATSYEALKAALVAAVQEQTQEGVVRGRVFFGGSPKLVFVFPGEGAPWRGMGEKLLGEEPVFRAALEACDRAIQAESGFSVLAELGAEPAASQVGRSDVKRPLLFALQVALAALWRSFGVTPDSFLGHGPGEVAAAHVAGALSLPEAVARICRADNSKQPIRFEDAVQGLISSGHGLFVELGPHPILLPALQECLRTAKREGLAVGSLRRGQDERSALLEALGALWVRGYPVDWERLFPAGGRRVPLPTYPFSRQRYWLEAKADGAGSPSQSTRQPGTGTPPAEPEDQFLELGWEPAKVPAPTISGGRFVLLGQGGAVGPALRAALVATGHAVVHAATPMTGSADVRAVLKGAFGGQAPTAVVHLSSLDSGARTLDAESVERGLVCGYDSVLATVQALSGMGYRESPRLWVVTRGAQATLAGEVFLLAAPLLGLCRVIAMEHAALRCGQIDLDKTTPDGEVDALRAELLGDDAEAEIGFRGSERYVGRIVRSVPAKVRTSAPAESGLRIRADGSYLVTGGLGGLGLWVAGWLAKKGAGHLFLVGRTGAPSPAQQAAVAALEKKGTKVTVIQADVGERAQLERVFSTIAAAGMPLRGVIHAAGVLDDGLLLHQTPARMRTVMAPKVLGALYLDALTRETPLDFFVLYSSAAGLLGSPGQGNYAAANTFLDALAHHRRARGLPGLSIDWGGFSEVGLVAAQQKRAAHLAASGMRSLTPDEGLSALEHLLAAGRTQVGVVPLRVHKLPSWMELSVAASRRFSRLVGQAAGPARGKTDDRPKAIAFLFTGQGSQYPNMARALYKTCPVFREAVDACAQILDGELEQPLLSLLYPEDGQGGPIDATAYAQPALFTIEYALARLYHSLHVEPSYLLGHSVGEYVAACLAGVFTLEDGLRLIAARGRLMQALPKGGAMVAIAASECAVAEAIAPHAEELSIAAVNAAESVTISGSEAAVLAVAGRFAAAGTRTRRLAVSHAFHSARMRPMLSAFAEVARRVRYAVPKLPVVSNLDGQLAGEKMARPEYWLEQVVAPVRFADGVATLLASGVTHVLELGPDPALSALGRLSDKTAQASWLPSLRRGRDDHQVLLESLRELRSAGVPVKWDALPMEMAACEGNAEARFWDAISSGSIDRVLSLLAPAGGLPPHAKAALPDLVAALASYRKSSLGDHAAAPARERAAAALIERLTALLPPAREAAVLEVVRGAVAAVLGVSDHEAIEPQRGFAELGLDSLMAVELRGRLQAALGVSLAATAAFDHPTCERLTQAILAALFGESRDKAKEFSGLERAGTLNDEQAAARIDEILADLED